MNASKGSENPGAKKVRGAQRLPAELSRVNLNAAGIDVGPSSHFVAVPVDRAEQPVQEFEAFTADLYLLSNRLTECGVGTVAMESTGVYWIPLFGVLEERGFDRLAQSVVLLVLFRPMGCLTGSVGRGSSGLAEVVTFCSW